MNEYRLAIVIDANGRPAIEAINKITGASQGLTTAQRNVAAGADRQAQATRRANTEMESLGATARRVQGFLAAVFGAAVVREIIGTTNRIDGMSRTLQGVLGSSRAAASGISFIRAEADRLGIAFEPALNGYTKLAAAARGTELAPKVNELTSAILQAGRAFNASGEQIGGAITAIEQMISKGTVSAEELRGQLGERIPGAFGIAARAMGVTTAELDKMLTKGEVVAKDFLPKFAAELERSTRAAAGLNAASPAAELERIGNELQSIAVDLGTGLFEGLGSGLTEFREALAGINAKDLGRDIGEALGSIARSADIAAVAMVAFAGARGVGAAVTALQGLGIIARPMPAVIASAGAAFMALNVPVVGSTSAITAWTRAAGIASTVGRGFFLLMGGWPGLLAAAAAGIYYLATAKGEVAQAADRATEAIDNLRAATDANRQSSIAATQAEIKRTEAMIASAVAARASLAAAGPASLASLGREIGRGAGTPGLAAQAASINELSLTLLRLRAAIAEASGGTADLRKLWAGFDKALGVTKLLNALGIQLGEVEDQAGDTTGGFEDLHAAAEKYIESLQEQIATLGMSRAEQVRWEAAQRASKAATREQAEEIRRLGDTLALKIELTEAATEAEREAKRVTDDLAQANQRLAQRTAELLDPLRNVADAQRDFNQLQGDLTQALMGPAEQARARYIEDLRIIQAGLEAAFAVGPLTPDSAAAWDARARQMTEQAGRVLEQSLAEIETEYDRFWTDFLTTGSDAFGELAANGFEDWEGFLDKMESAWKQYIGRMVAEWVQSGLTQLLSGGGMGGFNLGSVFGGGGAGGGGGFMSMISSVFGGGSGSGSGGFNLGSIGSMLGLGGGGFTAAGAGGLAPIFGSSTLLGGATTSATSGLVGLGGTTGAAVSGMSQVMSAAMSAVPWVALIAAGISANNRAYAAGWRPNGASTVLPNGQSITGGGAPRWMDGAVSDGLLQSLGFSASTASMLSGSALHTRLFGRKKPEVRRSESTWNLGPDGTSGSEVYRTVERGGTFRSDRWRNHNFDLGEEAQTAIKELFDTVRGVMTASARALQGEVPPMIDAALRTVMEYDSKGKVTATKFFVDLLGRTWEESSSEAATSRIIAESMIATIDSVLGTTVTVAGDAVANAASDVVDAAAGALSGGLPRLSGVIDDMVKNVGATQGEASAIAERWRHDAAMLLDGAGFLLAAATDMRNGTALITDGTLTQITDLVEELGREGESMIESYARLQASTQLYLTALGIMDGALQTSTAEIVEFADGAVEALGGLDAATQQLNVILETFFTEAERNALRLAQAQARVARAQSEVGAEGVTFDNFRARFEAARAGGLSPEEFAAWVRLGVALAQAAAASDALTESTEDFAETTTATADVIAASAEELGVVANTVSEALAGLSQFTGQLDQDLNALRRDGMNEFVTGIQDVESWLVTSTQQAHQLARATGQQAASEETLTQIRTLAAARIGQAIAALDAATVGMIASLYEAADAVQEFDLSRSNDPLAIITQLAIGFQETADAIDPQRYQQALQIAQNLFNLGWATGDDVLDIGERMRLPFDRFLQDLGVDLSALSDASNFDGLVQAARALGVELPELAARVGVNLGSLSDASSMINDGFERALARLTASQADPIRNLLRQLETAPEADRAGIRAQIEALVNRLPTELRALFAPFLDDVDVTPPEVEQVNATNRVETAVNAGNSLLGRILATLANTPKPGSASARFNPDKSAGLDASVGMDAAVSHLVGIRALIQQAIASAGADKAGNVADSRAVLVELRGISSEIRDATNVLRRSTDRKLVGMNGAG